LTGKLVYFKYKDNTVQRGTVVEQGPDFLMVNVDAVRHVPLKESRLTRLESKDLFSITLVPLVVAPKPASTLVEGNSGGVPSLAELYKNHVKPAPADTGDSSFCMQMKSVMAAASKNLKLQQKETVVGGRKVIEITYFKEDGAEFGIKQFIGVFSEEELQSAENEIEEMLGHDELWLSNTLDISPENASLEKRNRTKYFFPKYEYGSGMTPQCGDCNEEPLPPGQVCRDCKGKQTIIVDQCNDIPRWMYSLVRALVQCGTIKDKWANSAILNVYHKRGGKLCQHFDSPHLFCRPIPMVSFFSSAKELFFGVTGRGMQPKESHYKVGTPRGIVTLMYGYAANGINHAVPPVKEKAATLLFRRIHPELLGDDWVAQNTFEFNLESVQEAFTPPQALQDNNGVGPSTSEPLCKKQKTQDEDAGQAVENIVESTSEPPLKKQKCSDVDVVLAPWNTRPSVGTWLLPLPTRKTDQPLVSRPDLNLLKPGNVVKVVFVNAPRNWHTMIILSAPLGSEFSVANELSVQKQYKTADIADVRLAKKSEIELLEHEYRQMARRVREIQSWLYSAVFKCKNE